MKRKTEALLSEGEAILQAIRQIQVQLLSLFQVFSLLLLMLSSQASPFLLSIL